MIRLKKEKDIEGIRASGAILARVLQTLSSEVGIGVPLSHFDKRARTLIKEAGATPTFSGYKPAGADEPYPAALCTSVNDIVVHGLPIAEYILQEGDILTLDLGVTYKGYITDSAVTVGVGAINAETRDLLDATKRALVAGIAACKKGGHLGDIGAAISEEIGKTKFTIVKGLTGHGVGFALHEDPTVYNFGTRGDGIELESGLVLAIEPMVSMGSPNTKQLSNGEFVTSDGSVAAHFEHTIVITEGGVEIVTKL